MSEIITLKRDRIVVATGGLVGTQRMWRRSALGPTHVLRPCTRWRLRGSGLDDNVVRFIAYVARSGYAVVPSPFATRLYDTE